MNQVEFEHILNQIDTPIKECQMEVSLESVINIPESLMKIIKSSNNTKILCLKTFDCEFKIKSFSIGEDQENKKEQIIKGHFNEGKKS